MYDFWIYICELPTNLKEVEEKSHVIKFNFLHSFKPENIKSEMADLLNCANSFYKLPGMSVQLTRFVDNWAYDRKFNSRFSFGFVDCLLELLWIRDEWWLQKKWT